MAWLLTPNRSSSHKKRHEMMSYYLEKNERSWCGSIASESGRMWTMCLKMSETGNLSTDVGCVYRYKRMRDGKCLCRWVLLEVFDKVSPGSVNWKQATKPPIKMPFRKIENCNQVINIGKQLKFSLVNLAGNDIVQGNKKLIVGEFILTKGTLSWFCWAAWTSSVLFLYLWKPSYMHNHQVYYFC